MDLATQRLMQVAAGAGVDKLYVDDVFSTEAWISAGSPKTITNGIDFSGEGGMVWTKSRSDAYNNVLSDTERGGLKAVFSNTNGAEDVSSSPNNYVGSFNNNGVQLGTWGIVGGHSGSSGKEYATWSFRKAPGFFDVVTYTGNGSNRTISHSLGSVPGMIMVKRLDTGDSWFTYHRSLGGTKRIYLNATNAAVTSSTAWNDTDATSSVFSVGTDSGVNASGGTYVAYVFAGGESTAATARSVDFDGSDDYLEISSHADLQLGTGDFTLEMWWNGSPSGSYTQCFGTQSVFDANDGTWRIGTRFGSANRVYFARGTGSGFDEFYYDVNVNDGSWHHIACVRASNIVTIYIDGVAQGTPDWRSGTVPENRTVSGTCSSNEDFWVGQNARPSGVWAEGKMSNIRVVKGTAVYTSSFSPSTEPLTNITNTVLLICNNSSVTGSTVTPGTISSGGSPTASTDSPFYESTGFVFGANEDQDVINCGSYVGNGSSTGPEIYLGWEPQWVMTRNADTASRDWVIWDSMRGMVTGGNDPRLKPNATEVEGENNAIDLTPTGFKIVNTAANWNESGDKIIYMAIRRPDGYVGKPAAAGTDVFSLTVGTGGTAPQFVTGFPMDFALVKEPSAAANWHSGSRLTGNDYMHPNNTDSALSASWLFGASDYNNGFAHTHYSSSTQAWSWKRHAGFDVVTYTGNGNAGRSIPHSLSKTPEMMIVKRRSNTQGWMVYHKGLNGGTNPEDYYIELNETSVEQNYPLWNDTAPTSIVFTVGNDVSANNSGDTYLALLFASVSGISKVGSYTGNGSSQTITTGFSPRFILFKNSSSGDAWSNWYEYDTLRGIPASGTVNYLLLNKNIAQEGGDDIIDVSSTGFTINVSWDSHNGSGENYIYYAHS